MDTVLNQGQPEGLVDRASAAAGRVANDARDRVENLTGQATAAGQYAYAEARDRVRGTATVIARSVQQQPAIAIAVLGIVCVAVGFVLGRR
jgi:ElaB/YqjD/DUF883 family membrane-anchored ribosome-binding protein